MHCLTFIYVVIYNLGVGVSLSLATSIVLRAINDGHRYGFDVMEATGLPSGTIYPSLRRLQSAGLIRSGREADECSKGPPRKYFEMTAAGKRALAEASERYPMLSMGKG